MEILFTVLAYAGLVVVIYQTWPYFFNTIIGLKSDVIHSLPKVSIIIPARNEEKSLPALIESLLLSDYPDFEIIVVDDHSSDATYGTAKKYPVKVIQAPFKPIGWIGKSWACHTGVQQATGSILLFTDADTVHTPDGLRKAVQHLLAQKAVLLTAPSFYRNDNWWEKLLGPFYFLINVAATPYNKPSFENPYAIGQYMLFDRHFYLQTGGHSAIKESLAEEVDLARLALAQNRDYVIYTDTKLYEVQMYPDFKAFTDGWNRLLRLGMQHLGLASFIISLFATFTLTSWINNETQIVRWIPTLITLFCIGRMQRNMGNFSRWGVVLFPFGIALFVLMGIRAVLFQLLNIPLVWRGRVYKQTMACESTWAGKAA